jgi:twinkle protein
MLKDLPPINWAAEGIDTKGRTHGSIKTTCPKCSHTRKDKREPCLSVDFSKNVWRCHHCGWAGPPKGYARDNGMIDTATGAPAYGARLRHEERQRPSHFEKPKPLPETSEERAGKRLYEFFAERGISRETVDAFGVTTDGRAIQFPYFRDGELVNVKHRWSKEGKKRFRMETGCELILYNLDRARNASTVYIVEGEPDVLALAEVGIVAVVSPPNGAPDINTDIARANFDYLPSGEELFANACRVVMAGDMDEVGRRLMDELARRIGKEKCWRVRWPEGCKDANDTLLNDGWQGGTTGVLSALELAEPYPVDGITEPRDYLDLLWRYEQPTEQGARLNTWPGFSDIVRISTGQLSIWTGIPSSGKSVFVNNLALNLALEKSWKIRLFSPEYHPVDLLVRDLVECAIDKPMNRSFANPASREEVADTLENITGFFRFILPPEPTLDEIMYRAQALVYREGIKMLVIDPWTEIDQSQRGDMSMTDWVDVCLKRLRRFGRNFDVHVAVVAHPKKMQPDIDREGIRKWPVVTPYDISDSRHWYEMGDVICSVWRDKSDPSEPVQIHVQKVRFRDNGEPGLALFRFNPVTHRYTDQTRSLDAEDYGGLQT